MSMSPRWASIMWQVRRLWPLLLALTLSVESATAVFSHSTSSSSSSYIGAAVQFTPLPFSRSISPALAASNNVDRFESFIAEAREGRAQVIVFPEGATGMFAAEATGNTRDLMLAYCAHLPDNPPEGEQGAPLCYPSDPAPERTDSQYQVWKAACMAKEYGILLVMNLCEVRECSNGTINEHHSDSKAQSPPCPSDGRFQWNTALVIDASGHMVVKYHKSHLFGGGAVFDQAAAEAVSFMSDFGVRFGIFICFDMMYTEPISQLLQEGVRDILFPSWWVNGVPTTDAVAAQQAFSRLHNVNLIAANTGSWARNAGGGIYSQGRALNTSFVTQGAQSVGVNQLLIATIPILPSGYGIRGERMDDRAKSEMAALEKSAFEFVPCIPSLVNAAIANCTLFTPAILSKLIQRKQRALDDSEKMDMSVTITHGKITCDIAASFLSSVTEESNDEVFAAWAFDGVLHFPDTPDPLPLQVCALHHCESSKSSHHARASDDQPITCLPRYGPYVTRLSSFEIEASGLDRHTLPFPQLMVDDAQIIPDAQDATTFTDTQQLSQTASESDYLARTPFSDQRVVRWATTPSFRHQSLYSALIYGVTGIDESMPRPIIYDGEEAIASGAEITQW